MPHFKADSSLLRKYFRVYVILFELHNWMQVLVTLSVLFMQIKKLKLKSQVTITNLG